MQNEELNMETWITEVMNTYGYFGILLLIALECGRYSLADSFHWLKLNFNSCRYGTYEFWGIFTVYYSGFLNLDSVLVYVGAAVGASWSTIVGYMNTYSNVVLLLLIVLFVLFIIFYMIKRAKPSHQK